MKTSHTPGPWRYSRDGEVRMPEPCNLILSEATGACVAVTKIAFACRDNLHARHYQMEANARLIAAAPELLAALIQIARIGGTTAETTIARAAIAKATA